MQDEEYKSEIEMNFSRGIQNEKTKTKDKLKFQKKYELSQPKHRTYHRFK